ncbi:MAG: septum formation initiator family protein [Chitinophagaceae bacterium]|nr:septum formation initiator family protein [Chitinophagaceae bacterium]
MLLLNILKNKYFLATVVFLVWIFFFTQYDIVSQYRQHEELKVMKEKIKYLEQEVSRLESEQKAIKTDSAVLEKYAREKYYMKTPHEDVFVFDTISDPKK